MTEISDLPPVLAGPILRRCTPSQVVFWLVTRIPNDCELFVSEVSDETLDKVAAEDIQHNTWQIGRHCYVHWIHWHPANPLAENTTIYYDLGLVGEHETLRLARDVPELLYGDATSLSFQVSMNIREVIHGSCRKPHHPSADGLVQLDKHIDARVRSKTDRPNFLMMSGDQVYVDDVSGPTLWAIHQVIEKLGLFDEQLSGATVKDSQALFAHPNGFYYRDDLLPDNDENEDLDTRFWQGKRKPIFTSVNAGNHLITFSEMMAMYLLTWSPVLWQYVSLDKRGFSPKLQLRYDREKRAIKDFAAGLTQVRRVMAHLPCYMIFDDHDVTDDWNLTRGWEEASYNNPFSKRIIGNALLAYLLCQGWGNNPQAFESLDNLLRSCFCLDGLQDHDELIDRLLEWHAWHYRIPTSPPTLVLDTRTQRWRSESSMSKPSGLMDWESLCALQQQLIGQPSVILVSAAPIYGVKLIEVIQKVFTFFGKALTVDAENWMAHQGTANVMLNIFRHKDTPPLFIILSGDVHYSFVYDVALRFSRNSPRICQITASGIKNTFPGSLLLLLDKLNRWLFHRRSPLIWLTRRRRMSIQPRKPPGDTGRTLVNASGLGILKLDANSQKIQTSIMTADGRQIEFCDE